jgi:hypothetical protein
MTSFTLDSKSSAGIGKVCDGCGVAIDRRSKRCRTCNQLRLMKRRYPLEKRPNLSCIDCGTTISYQSAYGRGRCRDCYFEYRRTANSSRRAVRSADRFNSGTSYEDQEGNSVSSSDILYEDELGPFTVAHAWACLRKCWKGLKIAKSKEDSEGVARYYGRIQRLRALLNIATSDDEEEDWSEQDECYNSDKAWQHQDYRDINWY